MVIIPAPVGVTISPVHAGLPGAGTRGASDIVNSADVAGDGTGNTPCALRNTPAPIGNGDENTLSTSRDFQTYYGANNINKRVQRSQFVQMNIVDACAVGPLASASAIRLKTALDCILHPR